MLISHYHFFVHHFEFVAQMMIKDENNTRNGIYIPKLPTSNVSYKPLACFIQSHSKREPQYVLASDY